MKSTQIKVTPTLFNELTIIQLSEARLEKAAATQRSATAETK